MSSGSSGGGDWSNKLAWWPNAALKSADYSWGFEDGEKGKEEFFANCQYDLSKDVVTKLIVFKTPLSADYVFYCPEVYYYKLVHIYVIAETNRVDFSFAKCATGIEVRQGPLKDLHDGQAQPNAKMDLQGCRNQHTIVASSAPAGKLTIRNIIEWIFDSGEITGGSGWSKMFFGSYDSFFNNCKDFACLLYNNYTPSKNHIQPVSATDRFGFWDLTITEKKNPDELF